MTAPDASNPDPRTVRRRLLGWYDKTRRRLPWRASPGERQDPYRVWLSEVMLQQTTVATVAPYFEAFVRRWPTVDALARADLDDVLHAWQGLGYYARARNLHQCARLVDRDLGGRLPDTEDALRALPGVGAYTAAAVAAIAFGRNATPVDGNIERVTARLFAIETPLPKAKGEIAGLARRLTAPRRAGDFAQAMMDLGATVCLARRPRCPQCPLRRQCRGFADGRPEHYPKRAAKRPRPTRYGTVFWAEGPAGEVLMQRRPANGLLGGMMEFPSTDWRADPWPAAEAGRLAPMKARWRPLKGTVSHTFTHFHLELSVVTARIAGGAALDGLEGGIWCRPDGFGAHALPTVMKKVARLVETEGGGKLGPSRRKPSACRRARRPACRAR